MAYKSLWPTSPAYSSSYHLCLKIHTGRAVFVIMSFPALAMQFYYITAPLFILFPLVGTHPSLFYLPNYPSRAISMVTPYHTFPCKSSWAKYLPVHPQPLVTPVKFNIKKKNTFLLLAMKKLSATTTTTCFEVMRTARTTRLCRTKIMQKRYIYPPISKVCVMSLNFY